MVLPLPTAGAAGLIAGATQAQRHADRARDLARDPEATEDELRDALLALATGHETYADLAVALAELLRAASQ